VSDARKLTAPLPCALDQREQAAFVSSISSARIVITVPEELRDVMRSNQRDGYALLHECTRRKRTNVVPEDVIHRDSPVGSEM
jgi:hypothetical protein